MRLRTASGSDLWLTYCMNVHPGGTVESTEAAIRDTVLPLRDALGETGPFGLGLRFDGRTVRRLAAEADALTRMRDLLREHDLVPFTANGFVVGSFHGEPVKERVYAPDWQDLERLRYTEALAVVMSRLSRPGDRVSLSTAPGSWRAWGWGRDVDAACAKLLVRAAGHLKRLGEETGVDLALGLEPEPRCTIETTHEAIAFFQGALRRAAGDDASVLAPLGVCFDVCHQAVMHEDVVESLALLGAARIPVVKVQASCALELSDPADDAGRRALAAFDEPVYLHQVGARDTGGALRVADDLPAALDLPSGWSSTGPWRVHFHVPVFRKEAVPPLRTTRPELDRALAAVARGHVTPHLEIETYTWDVLPAAERRAGSGSDLVEALRREYAHVLSVLGAHGVEGPSGALREGEPG
jgi:sugar phosphate isomerase/epimerase